MKRVCQGCGKTFEGEYYALKCPDCVQAERKTTLRPRTCRSCGATFDGGPRAWYCPACRMERQREQQRKRRAQGGTLRPLGSTDACVICGKSYVVNSARQKYCPDCAHDAVRAVDREQSKAWNAANMTPEGRREARQSAAADLTCVVCGKTYHPDPRHQRRITCSDVCAAQLSKQRRAEYEATHREERNAYRRKRRQAGN